MSELAISIIVNVILGVVLFAILRRHSGADTVRLSGPAEAMAVFRDFFPDAGGASTVSDDRRIALIDLGELAGVGLLQRQGRRWNARILSSGEVTSAEPCGGDGILVRLRDFGWPRACIRIGDAAVRTKWLARLRMLGPDAAPRRSEDYRHA